MAAEYLVIYAVSPRVIYFSLADRDYQHFYKPYKY